MFRAAPVEPVNPGFFQAEPENTAQYLPGFMDAAIQVSRERLAAQQSSTHVGGTLPVDTLGQAETLQNSQAQNQSALMNQQYQQQLNMLKMQQQNAQPSAAPSPSLQAITDQQKFLTQQAHQQALSKAIQDNNMNAIMAIDPDTGIKMQQLQQSQQMNQLNVQQKQQNLLDAAKQTPEYKQSIADGQKTLQDLYDQADASSKAITKINQIKQILPNTGYTGFGSNVLNAAEGVLGINKSTVAARDALNAYNTDSTLDERHIAGMTGNTARTEMAKLGDITAGIDKPLAANQMLLENKSQILMRAQDKANMAREYFKQTGQEPTSQNVQSVMFKINQWDNNTPIVNPKASNPQDSTIPGAHDYSKQLQWLVDAHNRGVL